VPFYYQPYHLRVALDKGGTSESPAVVRGNYGPGYYAAYVRDPDGNKLPAVCYEIYEYSHIQALPNNFSKTCIYQLAL